MFHVEQLVFHFHKLRSRFSLFHVEQFAVPQFFVLFTKGRRIEKLLLGSKIAEKPLFSKR